MKLKKIYINSSASVVGPTEAEGPLKKYFDKSFEDYYIERKSFVEGEINLQRTSIDLLLKKNELSDSDVDLLLSGDLLNQLLVSNRAANMFSIPYFGLYNACATSVEGIIIAANMLSAKAINKAIVTVSSSNTCSEKQFRFPVEYGGLKPVTTTCTATGSSSILLSHNKKGIKVESYTIGRVIDKDIKDPFFMGAVMAPACADTIKKHFDETGRDADYYDLILSGDLGKYGKEILVDYMREEFDISLRNYDDTGVMLYDVDNQNVYSGASGPACAPLVTFSYIFELMKKKKIKKVLLVATGSLHSPLSVNRKLSIPSIAHAISLEAL